MADIRDTITVDVPLFIRLMELAREDIKDDAKLHDVATAIIKLSMDGRVLTMRDYEKIMVTSGMKAGTRQRPQTDKDVDDIRRRAGL
jgi:hypothetical protein